MVSLLEPWCVVSRPPKSPPPLAHFFFNVQKGEERKLVQCFVLPFFSPLPFRKEFGLLEAQFLSNGGFVSMPHQPGCSGLVG